MGESDRISAGEPGGEDPRGGRDTGVRGAHQPGRARHADSQLAVMGQVDTLVLGDIQDGAVLRNLTGEAEETLEERMAGHRSTRFFFMGAKRPLRPDTHLQRVHSTLQVADFDLVLLLGGHGHRQRAARGGAARGGGGGGRTAPAGVNQHGRGGGPGRHVGGCEARLYEGRMRLLGRVWSGCVLR